MNFSRAASSRELIAENSRDLKWPEDLHMTAPYALDSTPISVGKESSSVTTKTIEQQDAD